MFLEIRTVRQSALYVLCTLVLAVLSSCKDAGPTSVIPPPGGNPGVVSKVSYASQIIPIFDNNGCSGCHGGSGGLWVKPYAQLMAGGNHGPVIIAGNADSSTLIRKLTMAKPPFGSRMPLGGFPLPDTTVQVIRDWINQGAQNN